MICGTCSSQSARIERVQDVFTFRDEVVVIDDLPAIKCPDCNSTYYTADVSREIGRILQQYSAELVTMVLMVKYVESRVNSKKEVSCQ